MFHTKKISFGSIAIAFILQILLFPLRFIMSRWDTYKEVHRGQLWCSKAWWALAQALASLTDESAGTPKRFTSSSSALGLPLGKTPFHSLSFSHLG